MKKAFRNALLGAAALLFCGMGYVWLSFGVYADREFGDFHFFQKHRLHARFFFYSPGGESDTDVRTLSLANQRAEKDYVEFVEVWQARKQAGRLP